jgi:uncharacterized protein (UPF0212 family)
VSANSFECPHCGAEVRLGRRSCPECGSDAATGWQSSEEIDYRSVEVPEGYGPTIDETRRRRRWPLFVVALLALLLLLFLLRIR